MTFANLGGFNAIKSGEHIALVSYSSDPKSYTGEDLEKLVGGFVDRLRPVVNVGDRVGVHAENSANMIAAMFGILRLGGVAVPINTKFPHETIRHVSSDAELRFVLVDDVIGDIGADEVLLNEMSPNTSDDCETTKGDQAAFVLYTSGSTGIPKGVVLSHESQLSMISRIAPMMESQVGIIAAPLYHMNGLLFIMSLLAGGGTAVLMPRFDAESYLRAIDRYRVTLLTGVPTMLALCVKENELAASLDLSSVKSIQIGSAPLSEALLDPVKKMFPNASLVNGYGTTETGAGIFGKHPDGVETPSVSLGYPQPHVGVRLVGETPNEGVLEVQTSAAMTGYLNLPEKTAEKMLDGWINTGDVMRVDEQGFYYFVGRDDDMFVCGGENVYPGQVERLLETDRRIHEVCIVPKADEIKGQIPVAFVVASDLGALTADDVKQIALQGAPAYMHPRQVMFIDEMPLAGTNKIDRQKLKAQAVGA